MAGYYYNDPSGLGSWWVNDGETPEQARLRNEQMSGTPLMNLPVGDMASPGRLGGIVPTNDPATIARAQALQGIQAKPDLPRPNMMESSLAQSRTAQFNPALADPLAGHQQPTAPFANPFYPTPSPAPPGAVAHQPGQSFAPPPPSAPPGNPYPFTPMSGYNAPETIGANNPYGTIDIFDEEGNLAGPSAIPQINLGAPPSVSPLLPEDFRQQFVDMMNALQHAAGSKFDYQLPQAQAAQMGLGNVPQPNATTMSISPEIQAFLSGQGLAPDVLAQMRARATEDVSGAGRMELGQTRRALAQAGLSESPAGAAAAGDVARRTGAAQTSALRDIDINNAMLGLENQRLGVGYQQQAAMSNMEAANQMALANANRLFTAMSQNLANQQQTNQTQFGAESQRLRDKAGTSADIIGQQGAQLQGAAANRAGQADFFNAGNQMNQSLNQAQLDRQRAMENARMNEGRFQTGASILGGFAPNPGGYGAPSSGFSPIGSILTNVGGSVLDRGLEQWFPRKTS